MSAPILWLAPGEPLPPPDVAWGPDSPAPGLLAAGGDLSPERLRQAYGQGCFPWFSHGQPILWWAPDPRMVLQTGQFRLHRSLRKTLQRFRQQPGCEIRVDSAFAQVIRACAHTPRDGQDGTWIVPPMINAYEALHAQGHAHSVETWVDGQLTGGLYLVSLGQAVFGESMFAWRTDASKIALAALVAFCRHHGMDWIDCQQNTGHLHSLGAREIGRTAFLAQVQRAIAQPAPVWRFDSVYWNSLLPVPSPAA